LKTFSAKPAHVTNIVVPSLIVFHPLSTQRYCGARNGCQRTDNDSRMAEKHNAFAAAAEA